MVSIESRRVFMWIRKSIACAIARPPDRRRPNP
jgi:hypothetical protein